jgi:PAS domain S-box-containing protein
VERVPAVVYVDASDEVNSAIYMSPKAEEMLGYAPEEWTAVPDLWARILHPADRQRVLSEASRTRRTGEPFRVEYRLLARDGRTVWVRDEAAPEEGEGGQISFWRGVMLDVTERKRAEEALKERERRYRELFELAPVGLAQVAPDGRWLRVNAKLCELSGYSCEELLSLTFMDLTLPEDREASLERARLLLKGEIGPYTVERRYMRKDGSLIWGSLSVSLVRDPSTGEPEYFACKVEDITRRKLAEIAVQALTRREKEVMELMMRGDSNEKIARELHVSLTTVKTHVRNVLRKLGAEKRWELFLR